MADETQVAVVDPSERIAELEAQLVERDDEIAGLKPTRDVSPYFFESEADVAEFIGEEKLSKMIDERYAFETKRRQRENLFPLAHEGAEGRKIRGEFRAAIIRERLADAQANLAPTEGFLSRCLKMIRPDGQLVQIPYEVQVNNVAGSLADGYVRYERKGFKRTEPMLCPSVDCYQPSQTDRGNKLIWHGYCSEDHLKRTERGGPVPG